MSKERADQKDLLSELLESSTEDVVAKFMVYEGSLVDTLEAPQWCYVPGKRKEGRLLLVAHADTENGKEVPKLQWIGGVGRLDPSVDTGYGYNQVRALGGDDRTGCAALLWLLRQHDAFGHSVLITTGEESGLKGARSAAHILKKQLGEHAFAIEMDRRGTRQYVFYSRTSSKEFEEHVAKSLPGWHKGIGSSSDIAEICPTVGICGVNIAAGYFGEHSSDEMVVLDCWLDSLDTLSKWVAQEKHQDFPYVVEVPKPPVYPVRKWDDRRSASKAHHVHSFSQVPACNAFVCAETGCGEHMTTFAAGAQSYKCYPWTECSSCKEAFKTRQERVITVVHEAEALTAHTTALLSVSHRSILMWTLDNPGFLSKKMKKRISKLLLADAQAGRDSSLVPRPTMPTAGTEGEYGSCVVCGYKFLAVSKKVVVACPRCQHNPNIVPGQVRNSPVTKCVECNQYVKWQVDHSFACSKYPGTPREKPKDLRVM